MTKLKFALRKLLTATTKTRAVIILGVFPLIVTCAAALAFPSDRQEPVRLMIAAVISVVMIVSIMLSY